MNNSLVKVNCEEEDGYRKMVSALKEHKVPYYTYENKQTRPIRVVAKGLHHMWSEEEIHNDLLAKGYKIEHVSKQLSAKDFTTPYFELDRFLGICYLMSVIHLPNTRYYWHSVVGNQWIREAMRINRFEEIKRFLHFNDNNNAVPTIMYFSIDM